MKITFTIQISPSLTHPDSSPSCLDVSHTACDGALITPLGLVTVVGEVDVALGLVTHFTNVSTLLADNMRVLCKGDVNLEGHTVGLCIEVVKNKLPCSLHAGWWPHHLHLGVLEVKGHIRRVEGTIKCKIMDWSKTEIQTCSPATWHTTVCMILTHCSHRAYYGASYLSWTLLQS